MKSGPQFETLLSSSISVEVRRAARCVVCELTAVESASALRVRQSSDPTPRVLRGSHSKSKSANPPFIPHTIRIVKLEGKRVESTQSQIVESRACGRKMNSLSSWAWHGHRLKLPSSSVSNAFRDANASNIGRRLTTVAGDSSRRNAYFSRKILTKSHRHG